MSQIFKKGTYIQVPNKYVLRGQKPDIQTVYAWICHHADDEGFCFPSIPTLAKEAGISVRQCFRVIKDLVTLDILEKVSRFDGKEQLSNGYYIIDMGIGPDQYAPPPAQSSGMPLSKRHTNSPQLLTHPINSTVANATTVIIQDEIFNMEELTYVLEEEPKKGNSAAKRAKNPYGPKVMAVLVRKFAECAGIEIKGSFDASAWAKPLSALYKNFEGDAGATMDFMERACKYFEEKDLSYTPHTLARDLPLIEKWIEQKDTKPKKADRLTKFNNV